MEYYPFPLNDPSYVSRIHISLYGSYRSGSYFIHTGQGQSFLFHLSLLLVCWHLFIIGQVLSRIIRRSAPTQCSCLIVPHVKCYLTLPVSAHVQQSLLLVSVFQKISKSHPFSPIRAHHMAVLSGCRTSLLR